MINGVKRSEKCEFWDKYICRRWGFNEVFDENRGEKCEFWEVMIMSTWGFGEVFDDKKG